MSAGICSKSILLVDDDPAICEALGDLLREEGYAVSCVADGLAALTELRSPRAVPCLILLDLMMPRMDGPSFRLEQQRDPALSAIPVLVLSASRGIEQVARRIAAVGCIEKPIDVPRLLEAVERFC